MGIPNHGLDDRPGGIWNAIGQALATGNIEYVHEAIRRGADVNELKSGSEDSIKNLSPLVFVIREEHPIAQQIIDLLIASGAAVNLCADGKNTPLTAAAYYGRLSAVTSLIAAGADVNLQAREDWAPLDVASESNGWRDFAEQQAIFRVLLNAGARFSKYPDNDPTPAIFRAHTLAIYSGETKHVEIAINSGADPNAFLPPAQYRHDEVVGYSLLHLLADDLGSDDRIETTTRDQIAVVLLSHGANPNLYSQGAVKVTPLHIAADRGRLRLSNILLESGADPTLKRSSDGLTALDLARRRWQSPINQHVDATRKEIALLIEKRRM